MNIQAKKDLFHGSGSRDFTKGKIYSTEPYVTKLSENTTVRNDNNELHRLGGWAKHFKEVN